MTTPRIYLASPANQLQADAARGMPVLLSFPVAAKNPWLEKGYLGSWDCLLLDSGAFSQYNSGAKVDLGRYVAWAQSIPWADNWAALDDISGDYRRGFRLLEAGGFPTYHDTDDPSILGDLVQVAEERGDWIGIGLAPPRTGRADWLARTLERIPPKIHVHGWALGAYALDHHRVDSFDSTHWWREALKIRSRLPWLTNGEALELTVKKIQRLHRTPVASSDKQHSLGLDEPLGLELIEPA